MIPASTSSSKPGKVESAKVNQEEITKDKLFGEINLQLSLLSSSRRALQL